MNNLGSTTVTSRNEFIESLQTLGKARFVYINSKGNLDSTKTIFSTFVVKCSRLFRSMLKVLVRDVPIPITNRRFVELTVMKHVVQGLSFLENHDDLHLIRSVTKNVGLSKNDSDLANMKSHKQLRLLVGIVANKVSQGGSFFKMTAIRNLALDFTKEHKIVLAPYKQSIDQMVKFFEELPEDSFKEPENTSQQDTGANTETGEHEEPPTTPFQPIIEKPVIIQSTPVLDAPSRVLTPLPENDDLKTKAVEPVVTPPVTPETPIVEAPTPTVETEVPVAEEKNEPKAEVEVTIEKPVSDKRAWFRTGAKIGAVALVAIGAVSLLAAKYYSSSQQDSVSELFPVRQYTDRVFTNVTDPLGGCDIAKDVVSSTYNILASSFNNSSMYSLADAPVLNTTQLFSVVDRGLENIAQVVSNVYNSLICPLNDASICLPGDVSLFNTTVKAAATSVVIPQLLDGVQEIVTSVSLSNLSNGDPICSPEEASFFNTTQLASVVDHGLEGVPQVVSNVYSSLMSPLNGASICLPSDGSLFNTTVKAAAASIAIPQLLDGVQEVVTSACNTSISSFANESMRTPITGNASNTSPSRNGTLDAIKNRFCYPKTVHKGYQNVIADDDRGGANGGVLIGFGVAVAAVALLVRKCFGKSKVTTTKESISDNRGSVESPNANSVKVLSSTENEIVVVGSTSENPTKVPPTVIKTRKRTGDISDLDLAEFFKRTGVTSRQSTPNGRSGSVQGSPLRTASVTTETAAATPTAQPTPTVQPTPAGKSKQSRRVWQIQERSKLAQQQPTTPVQLQSIASASPQSSARTTPLVTYANVVSGIAKVSDDLNPINQSVELDLEEVVRYTPMKPMGPPKIPARDEESNYDYRGCLDAEFYCGSEFPKADLSNQPLEKCPDYENASTVGLGRSLPPENTISEDRNLSPIFELSTDSGEILTSTPKRPQRSITSSALNSPVLAAAKEEELLTIPPNQSQSSLKPPPVLAEHLKLTSSMLKKAKKNLKVHDHQLWVNATGVSSDSDEEVNLGEGRNTPSPSLNQSLITAVGTPPHERYEDVRSNEKGRKRRDERQGLEGKLGATKLGGSSGKDGSSSDPKKDLETLPWRAFVINE